MPKLGCLDGQVEISEGHEIGIQCPFWEWSAHWIIVWLSLSLWLKGPAKIKSLLTLSLDARLWMCLDGNSTMNMWIRTWTRCRFLVLECYHISLWWQYIVEVCCGWISSCITCALTSFPNPNRTHRRHSLAGMSFHSVVLARWLDLFDWARGTSESFQSLQIDHYLVISHENGESIRSHLSLLLTQGIVNWFLKPNQIKRRMRTRPFDFKPHYFLTI
jgi:hypothetical protein